MIDPSGFLFATAALSMNAEEGVTRRGGPTARCAVASQHMLVSHVRTLQNMASLRLFRFLGSRWHQQTGSNPPELGPKPEDPAAAGEEGGLPKVLAGSGFMSFKFADLMPFVLGDQLPDGSHCVTRPANSSSRTRLAPVIQTAAWATKRPGN